MLLLTFLLATAAPPPTGSLTLDMADPQVEATVAGRVLRLRVALDQQGVVELNPGTAAALSELKFEDDFEASVGRVTLQGRVAPATLQIGGKPVPVTLATHGRTCCPGVDGEIAPDLLPFVEIRFLRRGATPASRPARVVQMERDPELGLFARVPTTGGEVLAMFTLFYGPTITTAAGAAALSRAGGGRFVGARSMEARAFGVPRPVMTMTLDRPVAVAGFAIDRTLVRTADFRGRNRLPALPGMSEAAGDIRVTGRARTPQRAIPSVTIGRALLDRCSAMTFATVSRRLALSCN